MVNFEWVRSAEPPIVAAVAEGRGLDEGAVRAFADGRVFTGAQAQALGLGDQLGDEEAARRLAAELAGLDPEKSRPVTFGKRERRLSGLLPGSQRLGALLEAIHVELAWSGQPLWLYRP